MSKKSPEELFSYLQQNTIAKIELVDRAHTQAVFVSPEDSFGLLRVLKTEKELQFDCLMNQTAVHMEDQFLVYWHLYSYTYLHEICVETAVPLDSPVVDSVVSLWNSANWLERETFDLFGINFKDHPDLRRIMLPEDWIGHPLRKDYVRPDEYHDMDNSFSEITKSFEPKKKAK